MEPGAINDRPAASSRSARATALAAEAAKRREPDKRSFPVAELWWNSLGSGFCCWRRRPKLRPNFRGAKKQQQQQQQEPKVEDFISAKIRSLLRMLAAQPRQN